MQDFLKTAIVLTLIEENEVGGKIVENGMSTRMLLPGECYASNTRRSRLGLHDDPALCGTLYTAGGVGELYQRRPAI